jgi:hypothetical protein
MSKGKNECDEEYYANGDYCKMQKCAHSSVNCLAGTGDFRIGVNSQIQKLTYTTGLKSGLSSRLNEKILRNSFWFDLILYMRL